MPCPKFYWWGGLWRLNRLMSTVLHCHSYSACARAERELPLTCVVYLLTPNLWLRRVLAVLFTHREDSAKLLWMPPAAG